MRSSILAEPRDGAGISTDGSGGEHCPHIYRVWRRGLWAGLAGIWAMCIGEAEDEAGKLLVPGQKELYTLDENSCP